MALTTAAMMSANVRFAMPFDRHQDDYEAQKCKIIDAVLMKPLFEIEHIADGHAYRLRVRAENEAGMMEFMCIGR